MKDKTKASSEYIRGFDNTQIYRTEYQIGTDDIKYTACSNTRGKPANLKVQWNIN